MKTALLSGKLLLLFLILVHIFYYPTWNAGFVTDFTGLMSRLEGQSIAGVLQCFGFPALEQVLNLFLFLMYNTFGASVLPWYFVFTTFHAVNAYLLFRFSCNLFQHFQLKGYSFVAWSGALFFLLSPYQSEVLVWRLCLNYLLVSFFILYTVIQSLRWFKTGKTKHLIYAHLMTLTAFFIFELALMLPFLCGLLLIGFLRYSKNEISLKKALVGLLLPQLAYTTGYFLLNKLILGAWVGHYGAAVHLRFDPAELISNSLRFLVKMTGFVRYYPHPMKEKIFSLIGQNSIWITYTSLLMLIAILSLFFLKRKHTRLWLCTGFLFIALLARLPVLNLYFNYLLHIENDRYGYLASAFFFMALALVISYLPGILRWLVTAAFIIISSFFLITTNQYWKGSTQVYYSLLEDFRWYDAQHVFLLNLPDNLKGAPMFRDYSGEQMAFSSALKYIRGKPFEGKIHEIAQYNMTDTVNGVSVQKDARGLKVEFKQWGNWWWRRGIGATNLENNWYSFINEGHHYLLQVKRRPASSVFLYQDGLEWKAVKWE